MLLLISAKCIEIEASHDQVGATRSGTSRQGKTQMTQVLCSSGKQSHLTLSLALCGLPIISLSHCVRKAWHISPPTIAPCTVARALLATSCLRERPCRALPPSRARCLASSPPSLLTQAGKAAQGRAACCLLCAGDGLSQYELACAAPSEQLFPQCSSYVGC